MNVSQKLMHLAAVGFGKLPEKIHRKLAGKPVTVAGQELHPSVKLALLALNSGGPTFETKPLVEGRAELSAESAIFGTEAKLEKVEDFLVPGAEGKIPARLYVPGTYAPLKRDGLVVYMHGGGWVLGGLESADAMCRSFARKTGFTVISLDYRLAPENPFPAGVDDCLAAFRWIRDNAEQFGASADRILLGGESAGGNLTCVLAQLLRDEQGPVVAFPIFPVTDLSKKSESYTLFSTGYFLTEAQMDWYKNHYLVDPELALDRRVSPLLATDEELQGLCPHVVSVAGFDPLRDEGLAYAKRLEEAGVSAKTILFEGFIHGFINATAMGAPIESRIAQIADAVVEIYDAL
ncbi:MAG: alpha/beta hydrolase [Arcanobacterium sp.]|nr:alpha/beta hydrolase [Arcanobacterium sp.]